MLEGLLGSMDAERVLLFIAGRGAGYGTEIADFWGATLSSVQKSLDRLEAGGILVSRRIGRTRVYEWNHRWPFHEELQTLLARALNYLPEGDRQQLLENRRRPRRRGKPL